MSAVPAYAEGVTETGTVSSHSRPSLDDLTRFADSAGLGEEYRVLLFALALAADESGRVVGSIPSAMASSLGLGALAGRGTVGRRMKTLVALGGIAYDPGRGVVPGCVQFTIPTDSARAPAREADLVARAGARAKDARRRASQTDVEGGARGSVPNPVDNDVPQGADLQVLAAEAAREVGGVARRPVNPHAPGGHGHGFLDSQSMAMAMAMSDDEVRRALTALSVALAPELRARFDTEGYGGRQALAVELGARVAAGWDPVELVARLVNDGRWPDPCRSVTGVLLGRIRKLPIVGPTAAAAAIEAERDAAQRQTQIGRTERFLAQMRCARAGEDLLLCLREAAGDPELLAAGLRGAGLAERDVLRAAIGEVEAAVGATERRLLDEYLGGSGGESEAA